MVCLFTKKTFELFEELCSDTSDIYDFPLAYTEFHGYFKEFVEFVEDPFQQLCHQVATQLPKCITDKFENQDGLFNGIIYWDSEEEEPHLDYTFYFKGQKADGDAQFFINLNEDFLKFGFYIGENIDNRIRFIQNCQKHQKELDFISMNILSDHDIVYSRSLKKDNLEFTWKNWLRDFNYSEIYAAMHLIEEEVLLYSAEKLSQQIAQTFELLFPLALLAIFDNPIQSIRDYLNLPIPEYTLEECILDTGLKKENLEKWLRTLERKGQVIFYGSPGSGKTFIAQKLAQHLIGGRDGLLEIVQFHSAYFYEDFIQGIRPRSEDGQLKYSFVPGRFLEFCEKAESCHGLCVLIIDEINRANLANVFGELMYLLEYRNKKIHLAGSSELFSIPENVRIIGTMNTADRSIALVDHALRRRFAFIEIRPNYDVLRRYHEKNETGFQVDGLIETLKRLNKAIADKHYEVGISYFFTENLAEHIEDIWQMEIEPYLEEYFYDQLEKVDEFRWDKIKQQVCP